MKQLMLHEFHQTLGALFGESDGAQVVADYGHWIAEHTALRTTAGVLDLSSRSRLCLVGADRARFLHGQVSNDVKRLRPGEGCYAAVTTAKGKMESDLNILNLGGELLLDFEPGLERKLTERLEKFIVADDVQIVDAAPHYGLLSVQGPHAAGVIGAMGIFSGMPEAALSSVKISDSLLGDVYLANHARLGTAGFDVYVPNNSLGAVADKLIAAAKKAGGRAAGWTAFEAARIESGIPRYGEDMDDTNIPLECGIESRAIVYNKGCYIGQEVINRIHSIGQVTKELRGLRLADNLRALPAHGDQLFYAGREMGYVTSSVRSPALKGNIALGYVRKEANQIGTELVLRTSAWESVVKVVALLFEK